MKISSDTLQALLPAVAHKPGSVFIQIIQPLGCRCLVWGDRYSPNSLIIRTKCAYLVTTASPYLTSSFVDKLVIISQQHGCLFYKQISWGVFVPASYIYCYDFCCLVAELSKTPLQPL